MKCSISEAGSAVAVGESRLLLRVCDQKDEKRFCAPEHPFSIAVYSVFTEVVGGLG